MNNRNDIVLYGLLGLIVVLQAFMVFSNGHRSASFGGVVAPTRIVIATLTGDTATTSTTAIVPSIAALATTSLVADIRDADQVSFQLIPTASSSVSVSVSTQFQYSETATCSSNPSGADWNSYGVLASTQTIGTSAVVATTTYTYTPQATTTLGVTYRVPVVDAQCIRAQISAGNNTVNPNFMVWAAFIVQKKGYNIGG